MSFGHTRGDLADADFGDELDADARARVRAFQVIDELRQVFDGIDVVMRRRRDETDARRRMAHPGDLWIDLVARKLAAFAWFRALRDLDLQLFGIDQIVARHAEARAGDLLNRGVARITIRVPEISRGVFAAFARFALPPDAVQGEGERLVRFTANRAVRHRARLKTLDD